MIQYRLRSAQPQRIGAIVAFNQESIITLQIRAQPPDQVGILLEVVGVLVNPYQHEEGIVNSRTNPQHPQGNFTNPKENSDQYEREDDDFQGAHEIDIRSD